MEHHYEITGQLTVDGRLSAGSFRLVEAADGEARVELTPRGEMGKDLLRRGEVALRDEGGGRQRLVVHLPSRNLLPGMLSVAGRGGVDVVVHCPAGSDLELRTGAADVTAPVALRAVEIVTGSGDVDLDVVHEAASVKVGTGHVELGSVGGALEVDTGAGPVDVASATGKVKIRTASGSVTLGRTQDDVKVTNAAGHVDIGRAERGHLAVTATTGDVRIGIPPGRRLHLDVSSVLGRIHSDLEPTPGGRHSSGDLSLKVRATTGDITLRRVDTHAPAV